MTFGKQCLVIAEVAQAHDGSLGTAHAYIDAAARAGADAVKFQCHIAREESTPSEPWRVQFSKQDATRYDYWKRMEFTPEQWHGLKAHCDEAGVAFLASPFSVAAVQLLSEVGVPAWKVASGEITNRALFEAMAATKLPLLISTGMVGWAEIDRIVQAVRAHDLDLLLMQCTTAYPCPPERVGLNVMEEMRSRYGCWVGLSDHSGTLWPGVAAAQLGAHALEVHVTFSRESFGPDVPASLTLPEFAEMVRGIRFIETMRRNPVDKDAIAEEMAAMRGLFMRSVVVRDARPAGHVLTEADLAAKKPGTGIPGPRLPEYIGRTLRRPVDADTLLSEDDLEPA